MNADAALTISPFSLLVISCLLCSSLAPAQQAPGTASTGIYTPETGASSSAGELLSPGQYSSHSSALTGESALGLASRMGLANSKATNSNATNAKLTEKSNARSEWLAGSSSMVGINPAGWTAGTGVFRGLSGASWIAGRDSFGLNRQQNGIWQATPASEASPNTGSLASGLSSLSQGTPGSAQFSTGLTPRGAGLVRGAHPSSPFASQHSTGSGVRGPGGGAFGARSGFGSSQGPYVPHSGSFGSFSLGSGSGSTKNAPSSNTLNGPSLNGSPQWNGGLEAPDKLGLGTDDSTAGSSH